MDGLEMYNLTHSRELLKKVGAGRPTATYAMLELDMEKGKDTFQIPEHETVVTAMDNNQLKIKNHDGTYKASVVR